MAIIEKVLDKLGYSRKSVGPLIDNQRVHRSLRQILESSGAVVNEPYKQSIWVYSCVNAIAQNLMRCPFVLKKDAGTLEPSTVDEGEMYDLFLNPNPYMTGKTLIEATFIYFGLRGEAFWILEGRDDITKIPSEIWTFDPIRFQEVQNPNTGMIDGWLYKGIKDTFFSSDKIIHFKMYNPYNDLRGIGPIEAARLSMDTDYQSSSFNKSFFKNGAKVGGYITIPETVDLTEEQFDRLVKQFEDRHVGESNAHKVAVVEGGGKFTEAKLTQKDMDFIEGKKMTRQEILSAYKVNEVVLGIYTSMRSYEGIKAAHKAFWEECLVPKIEYFQEVLWAKFFSKIGQRRGRGRIWGEFDLANVGPLQLNYQEKIKTAMNMFHMGWPINDINKRLQLGMREVAWGNQWWVPGGFLPVTSISIGKPKEDEDDGKDDPDGSPLDEENSGKMIKKFYCDPLQNEFHNKLKKFLFEVRKKSLSAVLESKDWSNVIQEKDIVKLKISLSPIYAMGVNAGIASIKAESGMFDSDDRGNDIISFKETRSLFIVNNLRSLLTIIVDNLSSDCNSDDKVREVFNFLTTKSVSISKSEIEASFDYGKNIALRQLRKVLSPSLLTQG